MANKTKKVPVVGRIGFNFSTLLVITVLVLLISTIVSFFSSELGANEVNLSEFVSKIKNNEYSIVEIKNDGKAVATSKYIVGFEREDELDLKSNEATPVYSVEDESSIEEISLNEFYELIRPLGFRELLNAFTSNSTKRAESIYISGEFLIAKSLTGDTQYIVKDAGEKELNELLETKGISLEEINIQKHNLRTALGIRLQSNFVKAFDEDKYENVWVLDEVVFAEIKPEEVSNEFVFWNIGNGNSDFTELLQREGVSIQESNVEFKTTYISEPAWGDLITIGILLGFGFLAFMMFRGVQGSGNSLMKFGQSKARMVFGKRPDITFKDVAGVDEAKEELKEVVLFLKEPKRFLSLGARIPKGLLMVGPPGTGKTLLARAIAGEAGVPFFHTSGSEFEEMLVGAGASRVRDLFEKAKRAAPSIIFIDEIDAVARKRGTTVQSSTTEQTLNQILVEMDGFEKNTNVIVVAATNRPDVLDPAILRPGRFDRRVVLDLPDIEGRIAIIKIHAKNKPIADSVNIEEVAKRTVGFSGADIENMLNEAAIIVAKENRKEILFNDIEEAANKVQIGPAKKRKRTDVELRKTAYHEVGHAIVMRLSPQHDPVHRVTIVSRGMALGYTMPLPQKDEVSITRTKMLSKITALVAGYAAEDIFFSDVTSGAANDIEKATSLARRMVKSFGMSEKLGLVKYGQENELQYLGYGYGEQRDYSEESAKIIDQEVRTIMQNAYAKAKSIIIENKKLIETIVDELMVKEVLDSVEFERFFKDKKFKKDETEE